MAKIFRTSRSQSKYTSKYIVSYGDTPQPCRVVFVQTLKQVRVLVKQLKEQGYEEEKTSLSLTL